MFSKYLFFQTAEARRTLPSLFSSESFILRWTQSGFFDAFCRAGVGVDYFLQNCSLELRKREEVDTLVNNFSKIRRCSF